MFQACSCSPIRLFSFSWDFRIIGKNMGSAPATGNPGSAPEYWLIHSTRDWDQDLGWHSTGNGAGTIGNNGS